jgi:hypothetical protein
MAKRDQQAAADVEALARIRVALGAAIGVPEDTLLTAAELATAVERLCRAVTDAGVPGLSVLARDLS